MVMADTNQIIMDQTAALGLGTNLGNRLLNLRTALKRLKAASLEILRTSDVFETAPWGVTDQPCFLNACLLVACALQPEELLTLLKDIEVQMGRVTTRRWGERVIDIDILTMNSLLYASPTLSVPHADMHRRAFVLTPLAQILPDWVHPEMRRTVTEMEAELRSRGRQRERPLRICPL
jgi:2-amino-4-hydroxy-6-hydroxymethyldihydropteridine diphosphokinase